MVKENGIVVDDVMLDCVMQCIVEQNKLFMLEFCSCLEVEGMNYVSFCEEICCEILSQCLCECEVDNKVVVIEFEIDNYFVVEVNVGGQCQELDIVQILICVLENVSFEQLVVCCECVEDVLCQLKIGVDFVKIVVVYFDLLDVLFGGDFGWCLVDCLL